MKNLLTLLTMLLATIGARAQVTVDVSLDQDHFLPGESLPVSVRIVNRSGQTLRFGDDDVWLRFTVEYRDGGLVSRVGEPDVAGEFLLESSKRAIKRVDIAPYFHLTKLGAYTVTATVTIKEWNQQLTSKPAAFTVLQGAQLWEREFGVPQRAGATNASPEIRRYSLQQASYLRTQLMLYVQVTDRIGKVNRVFPLGPMLSFGQPEPQVDALSNLHVLYQSGPRTSSYTVINPDGEVILKQMYDFAGSRPRLQRDQDGNFKVIDGVRRPMSNDLPPPKLSNDNAQTPKP